MRLRILTSVSASRVRSSCKLSLMRARLFFSTRGFRVCRKHKDHSVTQTNSCGCNALESIWISFWNEVQTDTGATSASLPSASRQSPYLSVRFLNPVIGLIFFHIKSVVAGSSRRGHVGLDRRFCGFSHCCLFSPRTVVSEGAAGKQNRFQEEGGKNRRRGEAPCAYCAILVSRAAGTEWLLLVFIGAH